LTIWFVGAFLVPSSDIMSKTNKTIDNPKKSHTDTNNSTTVENKSVSDDVTNSSDAVITTNDRHRLFSSIFFGLLNHMDDGDISNSNDNSTPESSNGSPDSLPPVQTTAAAVTVSSKHHVAVKDNVASDSNAAPATTTSNDQIDGILNQLDQWIPHDPIALRQTALYKGALQMLQWQRDNYLVGDEYAEWRKNDRVRQQQQLLKHPWYNQSLQTTHESYDLPYDEKAISHRQLSAVASNFIPTQMVQNLLTPLITGLFDVDTGVLYPPIKDATVNLIVDQQKFLEQTMKDQVLIFLDNPQNRDAMKDSTQGMIMETARID
jgi:hypothetical protein